MSRERPILFSSPMVRALLDGSKTQTRRIAKPRKRPSLLDGTWSDDYVLDQGNLDWLMRDNPYGLPGDRLWVRETWAQPAALDPGPTVYRADYPNCVPAGFTNLPAVDEITWKPSIHMFRKDSRILLEITGVRAERLQDISHEDAEAEGVKCNMSSRTFRDHFRELWERINGTDSWDTNPWVWVVEFKRVKP
jgi:hypothetical protein